ncbi:MAG: Gfo/Idh/MocA family oxidoreductase [candidate division KSB1 bacterium]|nr:Gfo/Idh/MocA family oxidoreductase [candidate division KSB1 bacterium]
MHKQQESSSSAISRRQFVGSVGAAALFTIVPRRVLGGPGVVPPSDLVNVACIGVGGMGKNNAFSLRTPDAMVEQWKKEQAEQPQVDPKTLTPEELERRERRRRMREPKQLANIYALCDVDLDYAKSTIEAYPKAKVYQDFRKMLDTEKEIDAVVIATPDHTHAVIAMYAMQLGKHVFCQKPLTKTIYEARVLAETAKKMNVVTQMGNQGHASEGARLIKEWLDDGAIGPVHRVAVWTNRPIWPQGNLKRPEEAPIPANLDWDLWLGPAPKKPYHPDVCHFKWRGWRDYGTGALGDMGAHLIDHPFWALDLGHPISVQASSTEYSDDAYPLATMVTYEFPARGNRPPVTLTWYDGGLTPPRPDELEPGRQMGTGGSGVLYYGEKGILMHGDYGNAPRLIPESRMKEYKQPEHTIPRSPGIHEEWIEAIKTGGRSTTDFSYSGPLTEVMLLGNVAVFMKGKNTKLLWDPQNLKITNVPEANDLLHYQYREGWSL